MRFTQIEFIHRIAGALLTLTLILAMVLAVAVVSIPRSSTTAPPPPDIVLSSDIPYAVPPLPQQLQGRPNRPDFYHFMWNEFIALNWPAKLDGGHRGIPDREKSMTDGGPRVWETWKADFEIFPVTPDDAAHWAPKWDEVTSPCKAASGNGKILPFVAKGESVIPGVVNQAMGGPLVDKYGNYVRYEVRVNKTEFDEIVAEGHKWYLRDHLPRYPNPPVNFSMSQAPAQGSSGSYGAIEIKAAWRILTDEEKNANRYYTTEATLIDPRKGGCGEKKTVGLVGFHIAHKTAPFTAWIWATFEHVDNVPATVDPLPDPPKPSGWSLFDGTPTSKELKQLKEWGFTPSTLYKPIYPKNLPDDPKTLKVKVSRLNPIHETVAKANEEAHALFGDSVWKNYILIEGQWQNDIDQTGWKPGPFKIDNPNVANDEYKTVNAFPLDLVANTTMETFYQGRHNPLTDPIKSESRMGATTLGTSCLHCHYQAAQWDFSWMVRDQAYPSVGPSHTPFHQGPSATKP